MLFFSLSSLFFFIFFFYDTVDDTCRHSPTQVKVTDGRTGPQILEVVGAEHRVKVQKSAKTLVISGLSAATYYRASMVAHSHVGDSEMSTFLFTTANDTCEWTE